jgi:signal transduction histidine kinase
MARFVRTGDPAWAKINIRTVQGNFQADIVQVFTPGGRRVLSSVRESRLGITDVDLIPAPSRRSISDQRLAHYYLWTASGLVEVQAASIHPTGDPYRRGTPRGLLAGGRLWDDEHLATIEKLTASRIRLLPATTADDSFADGADTAFRIRLPGPDGRTTALLEFTRPEISVEQFTRPTRQVIASVALVDGVMMVLLLLALRSNVTQPLSSVTRYLSSGDVGALERLRRSGSEFRRIAQMLAEHDRNQAELRESRRQYRELTQRLVQVQEGERAHLARELHDEIGQTLTGLNLMLAGIDPTRADAADRRDAARALVTDLMGQVRGLSLTLRPPMLDDLGLLPTLTWFIQRFTAQTGVAVALRHSALERRFSPAVETAAYRIVQEALTNVARHSGAAEARVNVWADDDALHLQIEDHGAGFPSRPDGTPSVSHTGGLIGMRERAELVGGTLAVDSTPDSGTLVSVTLPLPIA